MVSVAMLTMIALLAMNTTRKYGHKDSPMGSLFSHRVGEPASPQQPTATNRINAKREKLSAGFGSCITAYTDTYTDNFHRYWWYSRKNPQRIRKNTAPTVRGGALTLTIGGSTIQN